MTQGARLAALHRGICRRPAVACSRRALKPSTRVTRASAKWPA